METSEKLPASVGRYLIESKVGEGSVGVVYRARDPLLGRAVAIKVPRSRDGGETAKSDLSAHFYREAAIAGRFSHPNVVSVHDVGRDGETDFMVMELVDGVSGRDLVQRSGTLPVWDVLTIVYECCRALDFIHYHHIVHRDIKPGNVLITHDRDHAKLVDFSVAHWIGETVDRVQGTLPYMSPEAFRRDANLDHRSDLFGMGSTMYEFLTGSRPFGSAGRETRYRILNFPAPAIELLRDDVPQCVCDVVERAMAKEPDARFQSALEFANAVHLAKRSISRQEPVVRADETDAYVSLRRSEWFGQFSPELVNEMLQVGETQMHERGEFIVREGEPGDAFYLLIHGSADVIKHGQVVGTVSAGDCFGEIALVATKTRSASVVASDPVLLWKVDRAVLDQASDASRAGFYEVFLSNLVGRLADMTGESVELKAAVDRAHEILQS